MESLLDILPYILTAVVLFIAIWAYLYIISKSRNNQLIEKRRWIEQLPSVVSTSGVLGTFIGITLGLIFFDTSDLDNSIPILLNGLKTAFFTSLVGMMGSLYLSKVVNALFDNADKGVSDINQAAGLITASVREMSQANINTLNTLMAQSEIQTKLLQSILQKNLEIAEDVKTNHNYNIAEGIELVNQNLTKALGEIALVTSNVSSINENVTMSLGALGNLDVSEQHVSEEIDKLSQTLQTEIGEMNNVIKTQFTELSTFINKVNTQIANDILSALKGLDEKATPIRDTLKVVAEDTANISSIGENVSMSLEALGNLDLSEQHVSEEIDKLGQKMTSDISTIVVKMTETDKLLNIKFDEFTALMKKNDTEALSEYLKKFASEFQNQMNNLINKLVEDNFKQLNHSISRLNTWQQENKEMIQMLTDQYKAMENEFENTSSTLSDVSAKSEELVASDGKLMTLINSLNQVMLEDKNFIKVIDKLKDAAELNKRNSDTLNKSASNLELWITSQKHFVNGINQLITKLDEISRFRDYNDAFWKDTKQKLQEGVSVISQGTDMLNKQVLVIDKQFYARLSTTLANLDACIQAMYNGKLK